MWRRDAVVSRYRCGIRRDGWLRSMGLITASVPFLASPSSIRRIARGVDTSFRCSLASCAADGLPRWQHERTMSSVRDGAKKEEAIRGVSLECVGVMTDKGTLHCSVSVNRVNLSCGRTHQAKRLYCCAYRLWSKSESEATRSARSRAALTAISASLSSRPSV